MMAGNGREKEAIGALREQTSAGRRCRRSGSRCPGCYAAQGWSAEADAVDRGLRKLVPDACAPLCGRARRLAQSTTRGASGAGRRSPVRCEAQANARYATLLRQRRWDAAKTELERLAALEPPQNRYPWLLARPGAGQEPRRPAAVEPQIALLRSSIRARHAARSSRIDRLAARAATTRARSRRWRTRCTPSRVDGRACIAWRQCSAAEHVLDAATASTAPRRSRLRGLRAASYDGPQVLVFDYMAVRIFDDGSSVELVHSDPEGRRATRRSTTLAEVQIPEGAQVLTLRTIKPDGRRLEPDEIEGKDDDLAAHRDAGRLRRVRVHATTKAASDGFPGGYAGDRFYFKSFEIPFDHSQMVVIAPKDMALQVDPRGTAPRAGERIEGDLRVLDFHVDQSAALKAEPGAVSVREYLPSVRIGAARDVAGVRRQHPRRALPTATSMTGSRRAGAADRGRRRSGRLPAPRARRLYAWVLEHIENNDDMFSQAAVMLRARSGNRARVLHYMLGTRRGCRRAWLWCAAPAPTP